MDRRQLRTRRAIFSAFETLLARKRYEQITVQDIIEEADIGRTTFYAHFETKDSLLDAICDDLFNHIFDKHPHAESDHDFSKSTVCLKNEMTHILYHLKADQERFSSLFGDKSADLFWTRFRDRFRRDLGPDIRRQLAAKSLTVPVNFYINFYISTFIETVKWWFGEGCCTAPETVESYFEQVTE